MRLAQGIYSMPAELEQPRPLPPCLFKLANSEVVQGNRTLISICWEICPHNPDAQKTGNPLTEEDVENAKKEYSEGRLRDCPNNPARSG